MSSGERWGSVPFPELDRDQLDAIVDKHGLDAKVDDAVRLPANGVVHAVYALGDVVLRVPKSLPEAVCDTRTEAVAAPVAHAAGVRTPRLVAFDDDGDILPVPFTIMERVSGAGLGEIGGDPRALGAVWRELGRDLARLHDGVTSCPDPNGWLDEQGRWTDIDGLLQETVDAGVLHLDGARTLHRWFDALRPAVEQTVRRCFVHGDAGPTNVLVDDGRYVALIDWGDAGWGDPVTDLRFVPARAIGAVLAGYEEVAPLADRAGFEARLWFDHLCWATYSLRRGPSTGSDWNGPPAVRLVELFALVADGVPVGRFA